MENTNNVDVNADMQERIDGFNGEMRPLLAKYELGLGAKPFISDQGLILAQPVVISTRKTPPPGGVAGTAATPEVANEPAAPLAQDSQISNPEA